jgi:putative lipoic acid-binding regulatory protein
MNKYPDKRTFTAIGSGGDDFKAAMVKAVEAVVGPVKPEDVTERPSSKAAYISVKVAVVVTSPEQVGRDTLSE